MSINVFTVSPHLQVVHEPVHLSSLEHGEHGLADVERVPPVVVLHWPVVLLHAQYPPAQILQEEKRAKNPGSWQSLVGLY